MDRPPSLWDRAQPALASDICHTGHIFWAAGQRPGYPPASLALSARDLILALQPPTGQEALPHFADEEMEAHGNRCPALGQSPCLGSGRHSGRPKAPVGQLGHGHQDRFTRSRSDFKSPVDPIHTPNQGWAVGWLTLPRHPGGPGRPGCLPSAGSGTRTGLADKQALPRRGVGPKERNSF